ncbi:MAG: hypothetical protein A3G41_07425 [Elusimicrobia bacterium RIFCSPLOWO2_12_FULL_59_9]|nr:MAG: hypothetical protein A3G41_07425 [Elusimicrobia bacterium RIFCSPLOWO2_12_FULL_59_9]
MLNTDVLIIGAGLAGMSCAHHLQKEDPALRCLVLEKSRAVGGLAGSFIQDGFTFDYTGHLLHLHDPYGKDFILRLLRGNHIRHERSAWIYSQNTYTRYPFQANTFGLPRRVIDDCVVGFLKTLNKRPPAQNAGPANFKDWSLQTFGEGISRHFMFPYNQKLWRMPLERLTTEWLGRFVPKPKVEEVLYGALTDQKKFFGYNASFLYPRRGGAQALPDALAARTSGIRLGAPVTRIDFRQKIIEAGGLGQIRYNRLVNTMPLVHLIDAMAGVPGGVRAARRKLLYNTVYCFNIGFNRPRMSDKHWIYFPEKRFPFYRAGFCSNFSENAAPNGTSSLYIEISRSPGARLDFNKTETQILKGLRECGLTRRSDQIVTKKWTPIPCAYVVYDRDRTPSVQEIFAFLGENRVESIGRYGAWKYSFMEEAIMDGKRCAERLLGRKGTAPERPDAPLAALLK